MHYESDEIGLLVEAVQDYAIFLLDPNGVIRSWNRGAERIMGYQAEEVIGRAFRIFYGPDDLAARKPERELEIAAAEGRVEDEGWRIRKDGTRFWVNTVITALRKPDGSLTGFAKVTRDLTERREAEERLRHSEELFRLLVQSVKDYAIFLLDPQGRIATWNDGAERIKGYKPEEIIGRHFSTFYREEDVHAGKPERELALAREQGSVEDEGWRVRKDGSMFWANVIVTAVYDARGQLRGFAKVTRDITERKRAEEMQRALLEQREARLHAEEERRRAEASYRVAQEANRAKDEFLMTLSHELRTPMTAILGWARLLPSLPPGEQTFQDAIASIFRSAELQARLIDDVLDMSRIVSGKMRLMLEDVDVAQLLLNAIEAVRPSADAKMITIETAFSPELGKIVGDPTRLQQVIWNLLSNAVKFTPKRGAIRITGRRTSSHLQVAVEDTGEGIHPNFLPHVFEPFRQAESPSTRKHGGLGLGLSIVRYIAEAHGGTVTAESRGRGQGATFTVTLPIGSLTAHPLLPSRSAERSAGLPQGRLDGLKIMLVDDDDEGRAMVRTVLESAGAAVDAVSNAPEALQRLGSRRPDILITDIAMGEMDGYALAREVRRQRELDGMKMVALSAFPGSKLAAAESGFTDYLSKPIDPVTLVDAIARVCD